MVDEELNRQEHNIEMIASESTAPLAVMELSGSVFTYKTLEGYPGKRFQEDLRWQIRLDPSNMQHLRSSMISWPRLL